MIHPFRWMPGAGRVAALALMMAALVAPAPVLAAESDLANELLEEMRRNGDVSEERYQELKAKDEAPATPAVSSDEPTWSAKWDNGFKVDRSDGAFKLKFGGRIQNDWAAVGYSDVIEREVSRDDGFGTEFRRARIFFSGTVYEHVFFKAQYDFADGDPEFKDVYMGLKWADCDVRVGHFKEPFSLDELTSSKYITFLERGLPNEFAPGRNTGIQVGKRFMDNRITTATGFFVVTDDFGERGFNDWKNDDNYDVATRITGLPVWENDGEQLVHLGAGYVHGFRNDQIAFDDDGAPAGFEEPVGFGSRPEIHLADDLIETPDIGAEHVDIIGGEFATVWGPASVQAEYIHTFVNPDGAKKVDYWGLYVQGSYFLTGEHRAYDPKKGTFVRTKPNNPFDPGSGDWGALEAAFRFSRLDLSDRGWAPGGKLNDYTFGFNWYPFANVRVMTNYIYAQRSTGGAANGGQVRFQIDF